MECPGSSDRSPSLGTTPAYLGFLVSVNWLSRVGSQQSGGSPLTSLGPIRVSLMGKRGVLSRGKPEILALVFARSG